MGHLNICSIINKSGFLLEILNNYKIDIISINETWLNSKINSEELLLFDYKIYRVDRVSRGGGVAIIIKKTFCSVVENTFISSNLELIHLSIERPNCKPLQVVSLYRPPKCSVDNFLTDFISFLSNINFHGMPLIILGDFNYDFFNIKKNDKVISELSTFGLTVVNKDPTRISSVSTCIDWIVVNSVCQNDVFNVRTVDVSNSDHRLLVFNYKKNCINKKGESKFINDYGSMDCNLISEILCAIDLNTFCTFDSFSKIVQNIICNFVPKRKISVNNKNYCYLSKSYFDMAAKRDAIFQSYKNNYNISTFFYFKKLRKICNNIARKDKKTYLMNIIQKCNNNNPKKMWRTLNMFFKPGSCNEVKEICVNNVKTTCPLQIASRFNEYFVSIISSLTSNVSDDREFYSYCTGSNSCSINRFNFIEQCDTLKILSSCKSSSYDTDVIPMNFVKKFKDIFSFYITAFINKSFIDSFYPDCFKVSRVIPIHKKGSKSDVSNYRPISLNSFISKIFERVVYDQITQYLFKNSLLSNQQFGFIRGSNTEYAFLYLLSKIVCHIDSDNYVSVIFFDFTKAFDSINHQYLLSKLRSFFGFKSSAFEWIQSYLNNRSQYVTINSRQSSNLFIEFGVPQGSVLGPLLFVLFINDMPSFILKRLGNQHIDIVLYADDLCILIHHKDKAKHIELINNSLQLVQCFCDLNRLFLNIDKTKIMSFTTNTNLNASFKIKDKDVEIVTQFKYLGYTIDSNLKFHTHFDKIARSIKISNISLARSRRFIDVKYLLILYRAFVVSHVIYNKYLIRNASRKYYKKIYTKILDSGSIIYNCHRNNVLDQQFNLDCIINYYLGILFHKIINNLAPQSVCHMVPTKNHHHNTRKDFRAVQLRSRTSKLSLAANIWEFSNNVPPTIMKEPNESSFKAKLKAFIFNGV